MDLPLVLIVFIGESAAKLPYALAKGSPKLRDPLRPEQQQDDEQDNQQLSSSYAWHTWDHRRVSFLVLRFRYFTPIVACNKDYCAVHDLAQVSENDPSRQLVNKDRPREYGTLGSAILTPLASHLTLEGRSP